MKLCNRDYSGNSMLSVETVGGVDLCTLCKKPAICHGKPVEQRALYWALSGDTGTSSEAICAHMTGNTSKRRFGYGPPSDASDRGRCIRLLELIPEWIPRLPEMMQHDQHHRDEGIVINSSGISAYSNSWQQQIPLIMQEGKL